MPLSSPLSFVPALDPDAIQSQVAHRLRPHDGDGEQAALPGVMDSDALEEQRYGEVLGAIDQRLTQARYSLLSMVVAGIYFGLLVGLWLIDGSTWGRIALWATPVLLVTVYGLYATHQTIHQIRHLSEARSLLRLLIDRPSADGGPDAPPAR